MAHFTPIGAAIGGGLIGLSAAILWLTNGRIAGISGILGALPTARPDDRYWRIAFLAGLIGAPLTYAWATGHRPAIALAAPTGWLILAGLLVGFGTRLGGGCTSGHGVCGIARLSPRSLTATALFMLAAVATVFVTHHLVRS